MTWVPFVICHFVSCGGLSGAEPSPVILSGVPGGQRRAGTQSKDLQLFLRAVEALENDECRMTNVAKMTKPE